MVPWITWRKKNNSMDSFRDINPWSTRDNDLCKKVSLEPLCLRSGSDQ